MDMLNHSQVGSKAFHLICGPARCIDLVKGIMEKRAKCGPGLARDSMVRPIFVWEPTPWSCTPSELPKFYEALKLVDVISPNYAEMMNLCSSVVAPSDDIHSNLTGCCDHLLAMGLGNSPGAVVVRLARDGCWIAQKGRQAHMPAYHRHADELKSKESKTWSNIVVDTTGAGNAFLGGYCVGLLADPFPGDRTEFETAAIYGSVAASFAIEQLGMPKVSYCKATGAELWNGMAVRDRLLEYESLVRTPVIERRAPESLAMIQPDYLG